MNHSPADFSELSAADQAFARLAQQRLRVTETLDFVESARLAAARQRAMAALQPPARRLPAWLLAPAALAAVALTVSWLARETASPAMSISPVNAGTTAALEWAADEAGPDFYRDLEFYQWLERERLPEPNA